MEVKYDYGSKPANNYDYKDFVKHIAPLLPKDDKVFFHDNSLEWRNNLDEIPLELFENICHWKSPRPFKKYICENTQVKINLQWNKALQQLCIPFENNAIKKALNELTKLRGVAVSTASALLTSWNPDQFGIIDFKVIKVLDIGRTANISSYITLRNRLLELREELKIDNCALRQIELAIWHYYSIQKEEKGVRLRC